MLQALHERQGSVFSASCLLASFILGISLLIVPVVVGAMGFWPGVFLLFITYAYVLACAFLYLEAIFSSPSGANVNTICKQTIGKGGAFIGNVTFGYNNLFFLGTYYAFGIPILGAFLEDVTGVHFLPIWTCLLMTFFLGGIVFLGIYITDRVNLVLFLGLIITFLMILFRGYESISLKLLTHRDWTYFIFGAPSIFGMLFFQNLIPSIADYLGRDKDKICKTLIIGTVVAVVIFILWFVIIIGSVAEDSFIEAFVTGQQIIEGYFKLSEIPKIGILVHYLIIFALTTSFLGICISLIDFFGDLFRISLKKRFGWNRLILGLLIFIPSILFGLLFQYQIPPYLHTLAGWGQIIFNAILPFWLVLVLRYKFMDRGPKFLPGGKWTLLLFALFTIIYFYTEGLQMLHQTPW